MVYATEFQINLSIYGHKLSYTDTHISIEADTALAQKQKTPIPGYVSEFLKNK
jgi:hypothetical protein